MTENEIIKVLQNELECVKRQYGNLCDNKRDCKHCDLALKEETVISAYENAIEMINKEKEMKRKTTVERRK